MKTRPEDHQDEMESADRKTLHHLRFYSQIQEKLKSRITIRAARQFKNFF